MTAPQATKRRRQLLPWLTVLPAILAVFLIMIYPILYNIYVSFRYVTLVNLRSGGVFIGLNNYIDLLRDEMFRHSMLSTLRYVLVTVVLQTLLAFVLAMLTYRDRKVLRQLTTVCLLLPRMVTPAASALIWRFMLNYETGVINYFLTTLGLPKQAFLTDPAIAMGTLNVIGVWQNAGFSFLLLLAGLMSMPYEMVEASLVDGAGLFTRLRYIFLPSLRHVLTVVCLFAIMGAFQTFDSIYMTTGGGPGDTTQVASLFLYRKLMMSGSIGEAAGVSMFLLLISFAISVLLVWMLQRGRER